MTPEIQIPQEVTALIQQAPGYLARVRSITSPDDYLVASKELASIKRLEKQIAEKHELLLEPTKTAYAKQRAQLDQMFKPYLDQLKQAKATWDAAITGWRVEQKRLADEENARRQEIVRKEQQRLREQAAAEKAKADEAAKRLLEKARNASATQAARMREQVQAKLDEAALRASAFEVAAATMSAAPVEVNVPKSDAGHARKTWHGELALPDELTDAEKQLAETPFEILICAVATGIWNKTNFPPADLLKLNETRLNKLAGPMFGVPGCRARCKETTVSVRGK